MQSTLYIPHGIIFINDFSHTNIDIPEIIGDSLVWITNSCIVVRALHEVDGKTTIKLQERFEKKELANLILVGDAKLEAPKLEISVVTSENDVLFSIKIGSKRANIKIWVNNDLHPDVIMIQAN